MPVEHSLLAVLKIATTSSHEYAITQSLSCQLRNEDPRQEADHEFMDKKSSCGHCLMIYPCSLLLLVPHTMMKIGRLNTWFATYAGARLDELCGSS